MRSNLRRLLLAAWAVTIVACGSSDAPPPPDQAQNDDQDQAEDQDADQDVPAVAPVIASFTASSATLPVGGGPVVLSWEQSGAEELAIDNAVGAVTGLTSKQVTVAVTTTFVLTATNAAGTTTAQVTVEVAVPSSVPTISSFSATPTSLAAGGGTTTLQWTVVDAASLSIDDGVGGPVDVTGSTQRDVSFPLSTTFTLSATNVLGTTTATVTVEVAEPTTPPSILTFTATPNLVPASGGSVRLSWTTSGASQLRVDNGVGDVWGRDFVDVYVASQTSFKLTATNIRGSSQSIIQVNVQDALPVISSFSSNPLQRTGPGYVTLQWVASNYESLTISPGVGDVTFAGGGEQVWLDATTTYTLTATNSDNQSTQASVMVTVN